MCTAAAAAIAARLVGRWTGSGIAGAAAAISAGAMSTAWLNATETEVYAAALLLAMLALAAAERGGADDRPRRTVVVAYLLALAPAVHLIALLAAPAAVLHAARGDDGRIAPRTALVLSLVVVVAASVGRGAPWLALLAVAALVVLAASRYGAGDGGREARRPALPVGALVVTLVALSALLVLLVRAAHDPPLNQGDPATLARLADVVARRQYDVAPLLPRQAPLWIQAANVLQYADWQVGLGIAPGVAPSVLRTLLALAWVALGARGALVLHRRHRAGSRALALLALAGSVGAMLYLNLKAGPTIGWGILPDAAPHEARERDYFFLFGFWSWGLWAGIGAADLAARLRLPGAVGLVVAALPVPLNWAAADRSREPEASITRTFASALLRSVPERGVLLVAADNDTYPLWYLQQVEEVREDVAVVSIPLLPADWYRAELRRRHALLDASSAEAWRGTGATLGAIAAAARERDRPLAASPTVARRDRGRAAPRWSLAGFAYVAAAPASFDPARDDAGTSTGGARVDSAAAEEALRWRGPRLPAIEPRPSTDPVARQLRELLECPRWALEAPRDEAAARSLDSTCNFR